MISFASEGEAVLEVLADCPGRIVLLRFEPSKPHWVIISGLGLDHFVSWRFESSQPHRVIISGLGLDHFVSWRFESSQPHRVIISGLGGPNHSVS